MRYEAAENARLRGENERLREVLRTIESDAEVARVSIVGICNGTGDRADSGEAHRRICAIKHAAQGDGVTA